MRTGKGSIIGSPLFARLLFSGLLLAGLLFAGGCSVLPEPPGDSIYKTPPQSTEPTDSPTVSLSPSPEPTDTPPAEPTDMPSLNPEPPEDTGAPYAAAGQMEIIVYDMGKADAILILTENHAIMIDTGENKNGRPFIDDLHRRGVTEIDVLIITHFDKDHVGGAGEIVNNFEVREVFVPDYGKSSKPYDRFISAMDDAGLEYQALTGQESIVLDGVEFTIYPALREYHDFRIDGDEEDDEYDGEDGGEGDGGSDLSDNDFSLVIRAVHGNNDFLFAGDAIAGRLADLLATKDITDREYDFLKVPHHGRYNRNSEEFIQAISPAYAVITDSSDDPADERVLSALAETGAVVFSSQNGDVYCVSDGETLKVTQ